MNNWVNIQCNKLMKLDDTMIMYGVYNVETLKKLINTVHEIHNVISSQETYSNMQLIQYYSSELFKTNIYHCIGNELPNCIHMFQLLEY